MKKSASKAQEALRQAIEDGDGEAIEVALTAGADPNASLGGAAFAMDLPLSLATQRRSSLAVEMLLDARARVDEPGPLGRRPLMLALLQTPPDEWLCQLLLERGASPSRQAGDPASPLWMAVQKAPAAAPALLAAGADPDEGAASGQRALHMALDKGDIDLTRALLSAGANPNEIAGDNMSPLGLVCLWASKHREQFVKEAAAALLGAGAQADAPLRKNQEGEGPILALAANEGSQALCQLLVEAGNSPEAALAWRGARRHEFPQAAQAWAWLQSLAQANELRCEANLGPRAGPKSL